MVGMVAMVVWDTILVSKSKQNFPDNALYIIGSFICLHFSIQSHTRMHIYICMQTYIHKNTQTRNLPHIVTTDIRPTPPPTFPITEPFTPTEEFNWSDSSPSWGGPKMAYVMRVARRSLWSSEGYRQETSIAHNIQKKREDTHRSTRRLPLKRSSAA